jgi:predicted PurR-regulated permease PerM
MKPTVVEISTRTIFKALFIITLFILAWQIRYILLSVLTAFILMSSLAIFADFFHRRGLSKRMSSFLAFGISVIVIFLLLFSILPPLIEQLKEFVKNLPSYTSQLNSLVDKNTFPGLTTPDLSRLISSRIVGGLDNVLGFFLDTLNGIFYFLTVSILSFYMLLERDKIRNNLFILFPHLPKERVKHLASKVESQLGAWLRGEFFLMLIVGLLTFIGLSLLGVKYALPLAIVAGLLEAIAIIGPILAAVPALIITFVTSPVQTLGVVVLYILIQQLENNFIVPTVMRSVAGVSPLATLLSLLIGASLFGIAGAVIAVPTAAIIQVLLQDYLDNQ